MPTYVITGVAGFLGSAVAEALVSQGATVRGIDNLSTGHLENLQPILGNLDFQAGDITEDMDLARFFKGADCVIHFAGAESRSPSTQGGSDGSPKNSDGTLKVLSAARDATVGRVVSASSCSIYATDTSEPKRESMALDSRSAQGAAKLIDEEYCRSFYETYGVETVSLRYFHVYGPGQDTRSRYAAALMRLMCEIINGETPTIYGDGETVRDLIYIGDAVEATLRACTVPGYKIAGRAINVGSGRGVSKNQLFLHLRAALDYEGVLVYGPDRRAQVRTLVADTSLAQELLGFVARENLINGIRECAKWLRSRANLSNLAVH